MLWFRNLIWYQFSPSANLDEVLLSEALNATPFTPTRGAEAKSSGFGAPASALDDLVFTSQGFHLIALHSEEKILPSSVVKEAVADKVAEIEAAESRKVFRREQQQLKEELELTLLPRAFTRKRMTRALIAPQQGWICVDASSHTRAEELMSALREALGSLKAVLVNTKHSPARLMTDWVLDAQPMPKNFTLGEDAELVDPLNSGSQIKLKGQVLNQSDVQTHLQGGLMVDRLALGFDEQLEFLLHSDLSIKRLRPTETAAERLESDQDDPLAALDTEVAHLGLELTRLLPELVTAFGGPAEA